MNVTSKAQDEGEEQQINTSSDSITAYADYLKPNALVLGFNISRSYIDSKCREKA